MGSRSSWRCVNLGFRLHLAMFFCLLYAVVSCIVLWLPMLSVDCALCTLRNPLCTHFRDWIHPSYPMIKPEEVLARRHAPSFWPFLAVFLYAPSISLWIGLENYWALLTRHSAYFSARKALLVSRLVEDRVGWVDELLSLFFYFYGIFDVSFSIQSDKIGM